MMGRHAMGRRPRWDAAATFGALRRLGTRHAWLLPIVVVAFWLRFANISAEHLYGDEAEYAIIARYLSRDLLDLRYPSLEGMEGLPFVSQPPLLLYMMAGAMRIYGAHDFSAMAPSILLGVGTVVVAYALGTRLGGRLHGIVAALVVAVLPFHVDLSRKAMLDVGYSFFLLLATFFLVAWLQTRRRGHAVGAGCAAAGAALAKLPGVLVVPVLVGVFVAVALVALARAALRKDRERLVDARTAGLHLLVALAPLALGAIAYLALLSGIDATDAFREKLTWQMGRVSGDASSTGGKPASFYFDDPHSSFTVLFGNGVLGLALVGVCFAFARTILSRGAALEHLVVPAMAAVVLAFFLFSNRKEGFYLLPLAPMASVLVGATAAGVHDLARWANVRFAPRFAGRAGPIAVALGLAVVAMPAIAAIDESLAEYAGEPRSSSFGYGTREAAHWIRAQDPEAGQYGTLLGRFTLLWYNEQPTYHWFVDHATLEDDVRNGRLRYIAFDEYLAIRRDTLYMDELVTRFNGTEVARFQRDWAMVRVFELDPPPFVVPARAP